MWFKPEIDSTLPPAILLGGGANALSVARTLRRQGVLVLSLGNRESGLEYSRFCKWIALSGPGDIHSRWRQWFTDVGRKEYAGAAIIPCGDDGLEFVLNHRAELAEKFLVYETNDEVLAAMLDKAGTHALAKKAGVATPEIWSVSTREDILQIMDSIRFPCGLKPRISHEFKKFTDKKLIVADNPIELLAAFAEIEPFKVEMMVTELIPGGDRGYCSYYSYLDQHGEPLFHLTKKKLRQHPTGFGTGTFHVTDWDPEVAALGLKFFQSIGLRGFACVEFKRDPRDGNLKLIEVNHRFTEPNEMMLVAGFDFALLVYNRLTNRPLPKMDSYRKGICLAKPWEDILAFRELRKKGELRFMEWLGSGLHPTCFLYFKWWDPGPFIFQLANYWSRQFKKIKKASGRVSNRVSVRDVSPVKEGIIA